MKNLTRLACSLLAGSMLLYTGCGNDDSQPVPQPATGPNLEFISGPQFVNSDQDIFGQTEFRTKVKATAGASGTALLRYQISVAYDGGNATTFLDTVISGQTFEYTSQALTRNLAGTEKWTYTVTDAQNKVASKTFTLTTTEVPLEPITVVLDSSSPFISANATVVGGTQFQSQILVSSNIPGVNLSRFTVTVSYDFGSPAMVFDTAVNVENFMYVNTRTARYVAGTETWTFTATDGVRTNHNTFTLTTTDPNAGSGINTYTGVLMGAQNNATYGAFLDAHTGQVMQRLQANQPANQGIIDLIYFYGATNLATIAAPDDAIFGTGASQINLGPHAWNNRNATRLIQLPPGSGLVFTNATSPAQLQAAYAGTGNSKISQLNIGDVIALNTADNKYGLALVESLTTGNSGQIKLSLKMQQ